MAFRRASPRPNERSMVRPEPESVTPASPPARPLAPAPTRDDWPSDEGGLLVETLRAHAVAPALIERVSELVTAPVHAPRLVDRLALALAAHFHFLPLEEALAAPLLLYGMPGAGVSTVAAKLAARFDEREVLVVSVDCRGADANASLAENLEVLGLPLAIASDGAALRSMIAGAAGRKVIIDASCGAIPDKAAAARIAKCIDAAGVPGTLVLSAETDPAQASVIAEAAAQIGTRRLIVTRLDSARYIGSVLGAADCGKLALMAGSVTPHFGFGLRALTPENLARRLIAAAPRSERWRLAPL